MLLLAAVPAHAVRPDEMLSDPGLEARARVVGSELRCLVCRNQSIDDSDADLAHDLRVLVRERIAAGDTNDRVVAYVRARYGDFVLLRPPLEIATLLLWGGPVLILVLGGTAIARFYRRPQPASPEPLSPEERRHLAAVLGTPPPFPPPLRPHPSPPGLAPTLPSPASGGALGRGLPGAPERAVQDREEGEGTER